MTISKIDLVCLAVIIIFAFRGYKKGAMGSLINLVGLIASFVIAWMAAPWITDKLMGLPVIRSGLTAWLGNAGNNQEVVLAAASKMLQMGIFALLVVIMIVIVKKIKSSLEKSEKFALVGAINKIFGMLLGILTAGLILTAVIGVTYTAAGFLDNTSIQQALLGSPFLTLFQTIIK